MKPILKWAGGKTQLISHIEPHVPKVMNNYHEVFVGGGSVLLHILQMHEDNKIKIKKKVYACDKNSKLINFYKTVQERHYDLYRALMVYVGIYDSLTGDTINRKPLSESEGMSSKESYYYWLRYVFNTYNISNTESAALFIFLNKTGFKGMYREGPRGFNVPYGHYAKTPTFTTLEELDSMSHLIRNVTFTCCDYKETLKKVNKNDFVYLDPPYAPENSTSFVGYTSDGFSEHETLFNMMKDLKRKQQANVIMSNANVKTVTDSFVGWNILTLSARRAINSKDPSSKTTEVLIM